MVTRICSQHHLHRQRKCLFEQHSSTHYFLALAQPLYLPIHLSIYLLYLPPSLLKVVIFAGMKWPRMAKTRARKRGTAREDRVFQWGNDMVVNLWIWAEIFMRHLKQTSLLCSYLQPGAWPIVLSMESFNYRPLLFHLFWSKWQTIPNDQKPLWGKKRIGHARPCPWRKSSC